MEHFPPEVVCNILVYLLPKDRMRIRGVNMKFRDAALEASRLRSPDPTWYQPKQKISIQDLMNAALIGDYHMFIYNGYHINNGANVYTADGFSSINRIGCPADKLVLETLKIGGVFDFQDFRYLCDRNCVQSVKSIVDNRNHDFSVKQYDTCMIHACRDGLYDIAHTLSSTGIYRWDFYLSSACQNNHANICALMIAYGANDCLSIPCKKKLHQHYT